MTIKSACKGPLVRASRLLAIATAIAVLAGCDPRTPAAQRAASAPLNAAGKTDKTVSAQLTGYNHTDKTIAAFYVNGQWGGNITPGSGGGSFVCCVALPVPWYEGLTVKVTWEDHELKAQAREVAVPRYDPANVSDFNVHFLRGGDIKVFAARGGLRNRDYPLVGPESELKPGVPIERVY